MANLKEIKNRIQSIESTKKITRAMKMVAAARVKKSESAVKASRPYTKELVSMFQKLLNSVPEFSKDTLKIKYAIDDYCNLLAKREIKTVGLLVITSNKGLAGAYNANVVKETLKKIKEYKKQNIETVLFSLCLLFGFNFSLGLFYLFRRCSLGRSLLCPASSCSGFLGLFFLGS